MVIVRIAGGLGNQMFHYAAARAMAKDRGCPLKLDISACLDDKDRVYALNRLNIIESQNAPKDEISCDLSNLHNTLF